MTALETYRKDFRRLVLYAKRMLNIYSPRPIREIDDVAEDVVQDAMTYVCQGENEMDVSRAALIGAVRFMAGHAAEKTRLWDLNNTSAGRRSRVTSTFPSQCFGTSLRNAFSPLMEGGVE